MELQTDEKQRTAIQVPYHRTAITEFLVLVLPSHVLLDLDFGQKMLYLLYLQ